MHERPVETIYGLNYDSCCWGLRFVAREYYNGSSNGQDIYDNAFYLVLELKGLSSFGDNQSESILQQTIPGYSR
jgi:LPS-assembly protein